MKNNNLSILKSENIDIINNVINNPITVFLVAGARPNFMKIAPIMLEMEKYPDMFQLVFIHTGQHYDFEMSKIFLQELVLPEPDVYLGVGSASHALQTARIMIEFEKVMMGKKPDLVIVVGDVNSTLACALVASKMSIPVAHVEAGLRSFDKTMPEEINRILTDQISDILFTSCDEAGDNLINEGISGEKIYFVGNVMIESLLMARPKIEESQVRDELGLERNDYALVTLHRPSNVDIKETFEGILEALYQIQNDIKVVFPAHPRTRRRMREYELHDFKINQSANKFIMVDPLGYLDFLNLEMNARFVLTDSGGIQEETTFFGVPCLTIRENTERPITVTLGTNKLVGKDSKRIVEESLNILSRNSNKQHNIPRFWDDGVSRRIVDVLRQNFWNLL